MFTDLIKGRRLAKVLATRDIRALYRQSAVGILWAFIIPLTNAITWIFLRNTGIVSVTDTIMPYPIYVFTGTMLWAIIAESIQTPLQKTVASKSLLTKVNFPRESLILSAIYQTVFSSIIKVLLMLIVMIAIGYNFVSLHFVLFPLGIFSLILIGTSIGLLLTPIGLLYTDIGRGVPIVMQFLMYLTPVVFVMPKDGWVSKFMSYNPLTPLLVNSRDWITGNQSHYTHEYWYVTAVALFVFLGACIVFRIAMPILIERMSS